MRRRLAAQPAFNRIAYNVPLVYGSKAMKRARLIALAIIRCSFDERPVRFRE